VGRIVALTVLVTGANGYIGRYVVRELLDHRYDVTAVDLPSWDARSSPIPRCDVAIHLAALLTGTDGQLWETNVLGTRRLAAAVPRLILASSAAVYGAREWASEEDPLAPCGPYAWSKACAEDARFLSLRLFNVYGGQGSRGVVQRLRDGAQVNGDGAQTRDFVHVEDVARAFRLAVESDACGVLNVGTGIATSVSDLAGMMGVHVTRSADDPGVRASSADPRRAGDVLRWIPRVVLAEWVSDG